MAAEESARVVATADDRLLVFDLGEMRDDFAADIRQGLGSAPKTLPPKYFYDELGSILFEAICRLPEYYVARAESEILTARSHEIVTAIDKPMGLVELGCGTATKTRHFIRAALSRQATLVYLPIDIDVTTVCATGDALISEYGGLHIRGFAGTFERGLAQLEETEREGDEATLVLFLGSTIGNLEPEERQHLLRRVRRILHTGDALLLGADLAKPAEILVPAYDDALGVTAAFNLNLLVRMNRELRGTFEIAKFRHLARYDRDLQRIEMHLVSTVAQTVSIEAAELVVSFDEGESIHTESSYKFTRMSIEELAESTDFRVAQQWTDSQGLFADYLLVAI